ncbi:uncharacterized protein isoform X2 [Leptinotarsa decemlineata]|uniref:uncharacterized protein isoform X2 n=1 Tax=Leptinotarsa decemlineata TaxID=7539 RepID=UPI003D308939
MACPPQSCCYCPGTPGPSGRPSPARSPSGRPSPGPRSPRGPLAHSSMRQRPDNSRQQHSVADETLNEINDLENLGILRRSQLDIHMRDEPGDELNLSHSHVLEVYPHEPRGGDDSLGIMDSRYMADERFAAADEYNYSGPDDLGPYPVHVMNELSSAGQGSPSRTPPRGPQRTPHAASPGRAAGSHMVTSTPTMRPNQSSCVCSPRSPAGRRAHDPSIMDSSHMARNMLGASNGISIESSRAVSYRDNGLATILHLVYQSICWDKLHSDTLKTVVEHHLADTRYSYSYDSDCHYLKQSF